MASELIPTHIEPDIKQLQQAIDSIREAVKRPFWALLHFTPTHKERHRKLQTRARRMKQTHSWHPPFTHRSHERA